MITRSLFVIAASVVLSGSAQGQITPKTPTPIAPITTAKATTSASAGCPGGNGIHISATSGTLTETSSGVNTVINLDQAVDTTLVFDITRKTWTRSNVMASITLGLADETKGRYAVCAGVAALLPTADLTVSGARGRVHFAASLKEFNDALRLGPTQ
jgi:hypothetical protein